MRCAEAGLFREVEREAKVAKQDLGVKGEEDVRRGDVAVQDAALVHVEHRSGQLREPRK